MYIQLNSVGLKMLEVNLHIFVFIQVPSNKAKGRAKKSREN